MTIEKMNLALDKGMNNATWFRAKAQLSAESSGKKIGFSSNIKAEKDKKFWMNLKKLMFEGGSFLCTSDSIMMVNRLEKKYFKGNILELGAEFEIPSNILSQINVTNLQHIFIGNTLQDIIPYSNLSIKESHYVLTGERDGVESILTLNKTDFKPVSAVFVEEDNQVEIIYSNYKLLDEVPFSYTRQVKITNKGNSNTLHINYTDVELNIPQKIKFSIPPSYSEMSF